jgi:hypothetical protein
MEDVNCQLRIGDEVKGADFVEYKAPYAPAVSGTLKPDEFTIVSVEELNRLVDNIDEAGKYGVLKVLGLHLYHILFSAPGVREAFHTTFTEFHEKYKNEKERLGTKPGFRLRLRLVFTEHAQKYAKFPWEFTYVPIPTVQKGFFLTGEEHELILARCVPEQAFARELKPQEGTLRILAIFSQPQDLPVPLDKAELEDLNQAFNDLTKEGRIRVDTLENPTLKQLHGAINDDKKGQPHIVHFIGHGKEGQLALIKEPNAVDYDIEKGGRQVHWVGGDELRRLFTDHKPRLVFLSACKGAATGSLESFSNTARHLVYSDVPVVVAMQYNITNADARVFALRFYQEIAAGKEIDEAVRSARYELAWMPPAWAHRRFGTPVVYVQTEKAIILPSKKIDTAASVKMIKCPNPNCGAPNPATAKFCSECAFKLTPTMPGPKTPITPGSQGGLMAGLASPAVPASPLEA